MKLGSRFKKKQPAMVSPSPTRDAYGFVVKPELVREYRVNAPLYVSEEQERADRWDGFLSRGEDGSVQTPEKPTQTTTRVNAHTEPRDAHAHGSQQTARAAAAPPPTTTSDGGGGGGGYGQTVSGGGGGNVRRSLDEVLVASAANATCKAAESAAAPDCLPIDSEGGGGEEEEKDNDDDEGKCPYGADGYGDGDGEEASVRTASKGNVWGRHSLNAVVAILEGRNPGRSGEEAPQRERELQALVHGGVPMVGSDPRAVHCELWQLFAGVQHRRRPALYQRLVKAAGQPLPPELVAELEAEEEREREEEEEAAAAAVAAVSMGKQSAVEENTEENAVPAAAMAKQSEAATVGGREPGTSVPEGGGEERKEGGTSSGGCDGVDDGVAERILCGEIEATAEIVAVTGEAAERACVTPSASSAAAAMGKQSATAAAAGDDECTPTWASGPGDEGMCTPYAVTTGGSFVTPLSTLPTLHTPLTGVPVADASDCLPIASDAAAAAHGGDGAGAGHGVGSLEELEPGTPSPASANMGKQSEASLAASEREGLKEEAEKDVDEDDEERDVLPEIEESAFAKIRDQVEKDLPRTFPAHPLLDGIGRDALKRVLFAYARHNPSVGYCQGMNFLAALLLLLMEEEAAFWCLAAIVEDILPGYFTNTMLASAVDQAVLQALVEERFPRISAALETSGAPLAAVSASWFLTLYVNQLPWECALRVWDVLLFERTRAVLFQTALALIDVNARKLLAAHEEDRLMECVVTLAPGSFDGSGLLAIATSGFADVTW